MRQHEEENSFTNSQGIHCTTALVAGAASILLAIIWSFDWFKTGDMFKGQMVLLAGTELLSFSLPLFVWLFDKLPEKLNNHVACLVVSVPSFTALTANITYEHLFS